MTLSFHSSITHFPHFTLPYFIRAFSNKTSDIFEANFKSGHHFHRVKLWDTHHLLVAFTTCASTCVCFALMPVLFRVTRGVFPIFLTHTGLANVFSPVHILS